MSFSFSFFSLNLMRKIEILSFYCQKFSPVNWVLATVHKPNYDPKSHRFIQQEESIGSRLKNFQLSAYFKTPKYEKDRISRGRTSAVELTRGVPVVNSDNILSKLGDVIFSHYFFVILMTFMQKVMIVENIWVLDFQFWGSISMNLIKSIVYTW